MLWFFALIVLLQGEAPGNPDEARFVTEDIPRFWQAYDAVKAGAEAVPTFQKLYLDTASPGLAAFIESRIQAAEDLVAVLDRHPNYYAGIRANTLKVKDLEPQIRGYFEKLKALYDDAVFPDVYFLVGRMNSGGTVAPAGLLIGTEVYGQDDQTPKHELGAWERAAFGRFEDLPYIVIHELIHFQQAPFQIRNLLGASLHEGIADYLCEMVAGKQINGHLHAFGNVREQELWQRFQADMPGQDASSWLYNGSNATDEWPADLGYYMGFKIAEAYYGRAGDKRQAVKDILTLTDPEDFLEKSGYADKFK